MSIYDNQPTGIKGLTGREPVGAALAIGIKDSEKGFPKFKDRMWIVSPQEENGVRPQHPRFAEFNAAPKERRLTLLGQLVHPKTSECFRFSYKCQVAPNQPSHPRKMPFCVGNGTEARRYKGADEFGPVPCLGEKCEYRQEIQAGSRPKPSPCKPSMTVLFRLIRTDIPGLPTTLMKYSSGGWNTIKGFVGFFDRLDLTARELGFDHFPLMGFRFTLQLVEKTDSVRKSRFPVVVITPINDMIEHLEKFLAFRRNVAQALPAQQPAGLIEQRADTAAVASFEDDTEDDAAADWNNHVPGRGSVQEAK